LGRKKFYVVPSQIEKMTDCCKVITNGICFDTYFHELKGTKRHG